MLEIEEIYDVWVTELEDGEIGEDEAVMKVARETDCGSVDIRLAVGGRANIFTAEQCRPREESYTCSGFVIPLGGWQP